MRNRFDHLKEVDGSLRKGAHRAATGLGLIVGGAGAVAIFGPLGIAGAVAWGTVGAAGAGRVLLETGRQIDYYFPRFSRFWQNSSVGDVAKIRWGIVFGVGVIGAAAVTLFSVGTLLGPATMGLTGIWVPWSITRAVKHSAKLNPAPARPPREQPVMNALISAKDKITGLGQELAAKVRGISLDSFNPRNVNLRGINLRRLSLPGRSANTAAGAEPPPAVIPTVPAAAPTSPLASEQTYVHLQRERLAEQARAQSALLARPAATAPRPATTAQPTAPEGPRTDISGL